jgi:mannose-6-phosphate isomerase-like protein (cupin superfamily)
MKTSIGDIGGEVIKDNETYVLKDNRHLKNLVLSSTALHPGQATRGHSHAGQEEVYYFVSGAGEMQLGEERLAVSAGDVVLIPDGEFHRVFNENGTSDLYFVCVFDGSRKH